MNTERACIYPLNYNSEAYLEIKARYPKVANHDGYNELFSRVPVKPEDHDNVEDIFIDAGGNLLTGDALAWGMARYLANPDRKPLYGPASVFSDMYDHAAYRLYVGRYEDEAAFRADIDYVTGMIPDSMADAKAQWIAATENITYDQSKSIMLGLIRSFGGA